MYKVRNFNLTSNAQFDLVYIVIKYTHQEHRNIFWKGIVKIRLRFLQIKTQ